MLGRTLRNCTPWLYELQRFNAASPTVLEGKSTAPESKSTAPESKSTAPESKLYRT
jgi:hypothetical protein